MGDAGVFLLIMMLVLTGFISLLLGWVSYKTYELKKDVNRFETDYALVYALEEAVKKLNEALKTHEFRLDHQRDERYAIKKRLDILESGHPDTDIDYGTVDDDGNIIEVWFEGKRYVPEDKRDEDTTTLYADNKVVAETTRPDDVEQLLKHAERLDYVYSTGLISIATYRRMVDELLQEELTHNDS